LLSENFTDKKNGYDESFYEKCGGYAVVLKFYSSNYVKAEVLRVFL